MDIYIGSSGFHYVDRRGRFYHKGLSSEKWIKHYAGQFSVVEINNTFYDTPDPATIQHWWEATPDHFRFTIKGNRYITHLKKLKPGTELTESVGKFQSLVNDRSTRSEPPCTDSYARWCGRESP